MRTIATAEAASLYAESVAAGAGAESLGWAFAAGYQRALRVLVPSLPPSGTVSLCVTEAGGNHPRQIETRFTACTTGYRLDGTKSFATLGHEAELLLVAAHDPLHHGAQKSLAVFVVPASACQRRLLPETPFAPEIRHAEVVLADVRVGAEARLEGDGYARYIKPFRTIEDIFVHAALLSHLAQRAPSARAELDTLVGEGAPLATLDSSAPETHLMLDDWLSRFRALLPHIDAALVVDPTWQRDRPLFGIAQRARDARTAKARAALGW